MEVSARSACSWWKTSTSSTRLLCYMVPLIILSVAVGLMGTKFNSSNWVLASNYSSWGWNSVFQYDGNKDDSAGQPKLDGGGGGAVQLDFMPRVVAGGGEIEEARSEDHNELNRSASPPLAVEASSAPSPAVTVEEEESSTMVTNSSNILPSFNETPASPLNSRIRRKFSNLEMLETKLMQARAAIRDARSGNPINDPDYTPYGPLYWNSNAFHRSYFEMEKHFKVFVYQEGEPPIFHNGPCGSIYSMEGNFISNMETTKFRTRDPERAHAFFLPYSVTSIVHFIYDRGSHGKGHWIPMKQTVKDYIDLVARRYPYWNRSLGADHFMLACHDWGPELSKSVPELFKNSIRALCNANTSEGFKPSTDVSIPEINLRGGRINGLIGGPSPSRRKILAFFAGGLHGPIRPLLLEHWENKDEDIQVHKYLPKDVSYYGMMRKSKYCICASGYEVASPRMVEALYTGCVPVLIKDHYVPPFSDVLNWKSFSVEIPAHDIPNLKKILTGISKRQYIRLQRRGLQARRHFEVNLPPRRYDVFHMILHSIWLRRLNVRLHGVEDS